MRLRMRATARVIVAPCPQASPSTCRNSLPAPGGPRRVERRRKRAETRVLVRTESGCVPRTAPSTLIVVSQPPLDRPRAGQPEPGPSVSKDAVAVIGASRKQQRLAHSLCRSIWANTGAIAAELVAAPNPKPDRLRLYTSNQCAETDRGKTYFDGEAPFPILALFLLSPSGCRSPVRGR